MHILSCFINSIILPNIFLSLQSSFSPLCAAFPMMLQHPLVVPAVITLSSSHSHLLCKGLTSPSCITCMCICVCVFQRLTCLGCSIARCRSVFTLFPGWLVTLVTGCLKMEAVCLMGRAVFRSGFPPCSRQIRIWMLVFGFFCSLTSYVPSFPPSCPSSLLSFFHFCFLLFLSSLQVTLTSYTWARNIKPACVSVSVWCKLKGLTCWDNNRKCVFVCLCAHK